MKKPGYTKENGLLRRRKGWILRLQADRKGLTFAPTDKEHLDKAILAFTKVGKELGVIK